MGGDRKCGRCSRVLGGNPCVLEDDVLLDFIWVAGWLDGWLDRGMMHFWVPPRGSDSGMSVGLEVIGM